MRPTRLATVSEYSRQDISRICHIPADNISVISNAARDVFAPLSPDQQASVRNLRSKGAPYFVFVGVIQPRKNLTTVLQAFDRFKADHDGLQARDRRTSRMAVWRSDRCL